MLLGAHLRLQSILNLSDSHAAAHSLWYSLFFQVLVFICFPLLITFALSTKDDTFYRLEYQVNVMLVTCK